jgi:mono/diheme cytochrome c family protein
MKRWIKRSLLIAAALAAGGAATLAYAVRHADSKMNRVLDIPRHAIALRDDPGAVSRGRYLYESRGCAECHGADGAGRRFIDDVGSGLRVSGPNISPGPGSVVAAYRAEDWERSLRHGVKPDGRPLMVMPSEDFNRFTDDDVAALVAYVRQLPPAAGGAAELVLPMPVRALYALGVVKDAAEKIDHSLPPAAPVPEGLTVEHGRYVGQGCQGCHGQNLSGGKVPGAPPDWPAAANLTPGDGSAMAHYPRPEDFQAMLRTGHRPDGSAISPVMPFAALSKMNELDTGALYLYLKSLPPRPAGQH